MNIERINIRNKLLNNNENTTCSLTTTPLVHVRHPPIPLQRVQQLVQVIDIEAKGQGAPHLGVVEAAVAVAV